MWNVDSQHILLAAEKQSDRVEEQSEQEATLTGLLVQQPVGHC